MEEDIWVDRRLVIPANEIEYRFTTSGGPGGQHANRSSTRVELLWNVDASRVLSSRQRDAIKGALRHRLDSSSTLHLVSDRHRSQHRNRQDVRNRLSQLLADALRPRRARIATSPTKGSTERRLAGKRRRSETKRGRRPPDLD